MPQPVLLLKGMHMPLAVRSRSGTRRIAAPDSDRLPYRLYQHSPLPLFAYRQRRYAPAGDAESQHPRREGEVQRVWDRTLTYP